MSTLSFVIMCFIESRGCLTLQNKLRYVCENMSVLYYTTTYFGRLIRLVLVGSYSGLLFVGLIDTLSACWFLLGITVCRLNRYA
jgi:hypothetical protein